MIEIEATNLSKKYSNYFILKNFNHLFAAGGSYAIKGANGVGKSTLIKMLCGFLSPSAGKVSYTLNKSEIGRNHIFKHLSIAAPYSSIITDFTLKENFEFIGKFKTMPDGLGYKELVELLEWKDPKTKTISQFSSGMQQKVNVCFAFIAQTSIIFLDEPTSFMDHQAKNWYAKMLGLYTNKRTTIVASNDEFDFAPDAQIIDLAK